jgi:hypothetical protein
LILDFLGGFFDLRTGLCTSFSSFTDGIEEDSTFSAIGIEEKRRKIG